MSARIRSIEVATPAATLTRARWIELAKRLAPEGVAGGVIERLAERSGIDRRSSAATPEEGSGLYADAAGEVTPRETPGTAARMRLWRETAFAMAAEASGRAIERSGLDARTITHCITASCTGYESPGIDARLVEELGMDRGCRRLNIGHMGCHAAVNALASARDAVLADPSARVLVCCTEVSSAHFHRSARMDRLVANAIFADGCAAAVIDAEGDGPELAAVATTLIPGTADEMRWTVGDHGFEMTLGARVPDILQGTVGPWVRGVLTANGLDTADVGGWAIHPGGPRVLDAVRDALRLPASADEHSRAVLREHGNMSSATLLFILRRLREAGVPRPWVGLAFGPGLVGEMVLVR